MGDCMPPNHKEIINIKINGMLDLMYKVTAETKLYNYILLGYIIFSVESFTLIKSQTFHIFFQLQFLMEMLLE